jgi:hypothetical protein
MIMTAAFPGGPMDVTHAVHTDVSISLDRSLHRHGNNLAIGTAVDTERIERDLEFAISHQRATGERPGDRAGADEAKGDGVGFHKVNAEIVKS